MNAPVLKTGGASRPSWVRIPPSPPISPIDEGINQTLFQSDQPARVQWIVNGSGCQRMKFAFECNRSRSRSVGAAIVMLLIVVACGGGSHATFTVKGVGPTEDATVELEYCDRTVQMERQKADFTASVRVTCEGEATVRLGRPDGGGLTCDAGYISLAGPDAMYEVTVVDQQCSVKVDL